MSINKKKNPYFLVLVFVLLTSFLTSCAGGGQAVASWPEVTIDLDRETAYLAAGPFLHAINLTNGSEKWHFPAEANNKISFYAAPALTQDGQVILSGYDHKVYSLDPASGAEKWVFSEGTNRYIASPLAYETGIYAPSSDNFLYALDLSGISRWKFETDHVQWSTPATDGKNLFLPSMNHHIHALEIETGNLVWESEDLGGSIAGSLALGPDGVMYAGTIGSELLAIDMQNGQVKWRMPADGWVWSGPVLDGDRLYFGDMAGSVYAVNARDGSVIWKIQPDTGENRAITGKPLVMGDALYFGAASGTLYSVNTSDGSPRWNKIFEGKMHFGPYAAGERILVAPTAKAPTLVALDLNGNQVWAFSQKK